MGQIESMPDEAQASSGVDVEQHSLYIIREYRKYAFPEAFAQMGNYPFFSSENAVQWCNIRPLELFMANFEELPHENTSEFVNMQTCRVTVAQLKSYRDFMLPPRFQNDSYFSLDNAENWVKQRPLDAYLAWCAAQASRATPTMSMSMQARSAAPAGRDDTAATTGSVYAPAANDEEFWARAERSIRDTDERTLRRLLSQFPALEQGVESGE